MLNKRLATLWNCTVALGVLIAVLACTVVATAPDAEPSPTPKATVVAEPTPAEQPVTWNNSYVTITEFGESTLEERLLRATVVIRGTLTSVAASYTSLPGYSGYIPAVEFAFSATEYIKGSGGPSVTAWAYADFRFMANTYAAIADATMAAQDIVDSRDTQYDSREALVFLYDEPFGVSLQADHYWVGIVWLESDSFSIFYHNHKAWLPRAQAVTQGAAGENRNTLADTERYFLTDVPTASSRGATGASGATLEQPKTSLAAIKSRLTELEAEITAGGGTAAYRLCIQEKYSLASFHDYAAAREGSSYYTEHRLTATSGQPANTMVYESFIYEGMADSERTAADPGNRGLITGTNAALFADKWPYRVATARPLPAGTYSFYHAPNDPAWIPCDAVPTKAKQRDSVILTVTPPPDTLHEAFFDPVTIGTGVGADSSNGVLNPNSFTVDGTSTSITGLEWDSGSVTVTLSPYSSLSGHRLDFIELDGSVSLSLAVSSATEDTVAGTLTWPAATQPWHDGDMLMLRIGPSTTPAPIPTPEPTSTPVPTPTPPPVPSSNVTVTLAPRTELYGTATTITVNWTDPDNCDFEYRVGLYDSQDNLTRNFGRHAAPATTSLSVETSLSWDAMPTTDLAARVYCEPLFTTQLRLIGVATLQSGLPGSP